jgi:hypothetical protein
MMNFYHAIFLGLLIFLLLLSTAVFYHMILGG